MENTRGEYLSDVSILRSLLTQLPQIVQYAILVNNLVQFHTIEFTRSVKLKGGLVVKYGMVCEPADDCTISFLY